MSGLTILTKTFAVVIFLKQDGHIASECTNEKVSSCFNCLGTGHVAAECPNPKKVMCYTCNTEGEQMFPSQLLPYWIILKFGFALLFNVQATSPRTAPRPLTA